LAWFPERAPVSAPSFTFGLRLVVVDFLLGEIEGCQALAEVEAVVGNGCRT